MDQEITRIQLLTDQGASAFYEQVTAYMENKYGLDKVKKLVGQTDTWKAGEEALQNYERDGAKTEQELQELLSQKEELPEEEHASCRSDYAKGTCNVKEKHYVIGNGIS